MRNGGALTTWTLMDMTAGVRWTGDQEAIEGYYKSKQINDTAFYIRTCSYEHINRQGEIMKKLKISLFVVSVLLVICGALMITTADGSAQELESLMVILIASVFLVGTAIFHAIDSLRKSIEDKS